MRWFDRVVMKFGMLFGRRLAAAQLDEELRVKFYERSRA